jgi:DNA polymerase V
MPAQPQQLALVDCNNFYVSCERLFRPDLIQTPVVVLSNNDGCVVSRSNEVKALGVRMGQPWFEIKQLAQAHGILALSSNYALYADLSNRVMRVLAGFSPRCEIYSIDECFVDLTGMAKIREISYHMRSRIMQWLGIPVCVGIGPTKTLAKLANHVAKKHPRSKGVFNYNDLTEQQQAALLQQIPAGEIWGVGRKLSARLAQRGIHTAYDLRSAHTPTLRDNFGVVMEKTQRELQGTACIHLEEITPPKKQIVASRSFGVMTQEIAPMKDAITTFVGLACAKLRAQGSQTSFVQVFMQTNRFRRDQPQYMPALAVAMPQPTQDTLVVNRWAQQLVDHMWKPGYQYKKAGVILSEISPITYQQGDLLAPLATGDHALMGAMDRINQRYGRGTVALSAQCVSQDWKMKQESKSPNYTTCWQSLPRVG